MMMIGSACFRTKKKGTASRTRVVPPFRTKTAHTHTTFGFSTGKGWRSQKKEACRASEVLLGMWHVHRYLNTLSSPTPTSDGKSIDREGVMKRCCTLVWEASRHFETKPIMGTVDKKWEQKPNWGCSFFSPTLKPSLRMSRTSVICKCQKGYPALL